MDEGDHQCPGSRPDPFGAGRAQGPFSLRRRHRRILLRLPPRPRNLRPHVLPPRRAGLLPDALSVLARIPDELGRPPDESTFLDLLRAYGGAHRPVDAYRLFQEGPSALRICPSHRSYTAILAVLVAEKRLDLARSVYESMRAAGVPPTVASYNVLLKALCTDAGGRGPKVHSAIRVFRRMSDRGCPPDACSYNTLIDGLSTSLIHGLCHSNLFDEALELFDEMKKRGIKPNVVTYSSLIDGLCKGGRSVKAMALVDRMIADRCQPNAITYSALISGLCTEGRLTEAIEALGMGKSQMLVYMGSSSRVCVILVSVRKLRIT